MESALTRLDEWYTRCLTRVKQYETVRIHGRVQSVNGILVHTRLPNAKIGDLCRIERSDNSPLLAEIIGFNRNDALLSVLGGLEGVSLWNQVEPLGYPHSVHVNDDLLGQVLDGFGRPLGADIGGAFVDGSVESSSTVIGNAEVPSKRPSICQPIETGVRALDGLVTLGKGQRVALFAGPGCGKTTLISEIARNADCDVIVFGMVGERGRELRQFIDHELDEELRQRAVIVCSTSDCSSMERSRAAFTATAIAESYRKRGMHVLLLIDSLTRYVRAQREIGLAAGEPMGRGGLPPSVYGMLPRLLERAGLSEKGAITAIYTVLIEQDSMNDPVADEVRSLVDGHVVLSRKLAEQGHYPAIDILSSLSRVQNDITGIEHRRAATEFRRLMSAYNDVEIMLRLGEYQPGADPIVDRAVAAREAMLGFLRQELREPIPSAETLKYLQELTHYAA